MIKLYKNKASLEEKIKLLENKVLFLEKKTAALEAKLGDASVVSEKKSNKKSSSKKNDKSSKELTKEEKREAKIKKALDKTLPTVMERTGWTREEAEKRFRATQSRIGCTPTEFMLYRLYEMTEEQQDTVFLAKYQKVLQKKYGTDKAFVDILYDKERTNEYFAEFIRRPWCVNTKVDLEKFKETFKDSKRIIYKPNSGHCGYGVEAFDISDNAGKEAAFNKLKDMPVGVVEEYIVQHPDMMKLCPSSVNSLRVVTISSNSNPVGENGRTYDIVYAGVRIGQGNAIVDNLHSGGMVANVDLETGVLMNNAADCAGNVFEKHPDTGTVIKGFKIPCFDEAIEMVKRAIEKNKVEGYIGWDIAISEKGPMFLEVNDRPGVVVLQTAAAQEMKGMKYLMEKYL